MEIQQMSHDLEFNQERIRGRVTRIFPKEGYIWIQGEDGVSYFGHVSHMREGLLEDVRIGQVGAFVPNKGDKPREKGPYATMIELEW